MIGPFHLASAYLKMLGKKMDGSGLSDILLEAGLIASGSLYGVLSGKNYDRAMHCHKVMLECLERLLLEQFIVGRGDNELLSSIPDESQRKLIELMQSTNTDTLDAALADRDLVAYTQEYAQYRTDVREGKLGKTAHLWLSYMDHVWMVLSLTQAVKHNDYPMYVQCLHSMADLVFSFGGQNYSRYLTYFATFMANIELSHPGASDLIKRGAISVARSFIPGNRCAVDKTMEETFMKHAKSHGGAGGSGAGVSGILTNYDAYQRWIRTTHARSQYVNTMLNMADMLSDSAEGTKHRDLRPAEIIRSEKCVTKAQDAVESFLNHFTVDTNDQLIILSSGASASVEVTKDVLRAEQAGKEAKDAFIESRLRTGKYFFEPVKRMKLKTLGDMSKKAKVTSSKNKVTQYKQQGNIAFQLFVKSQNEGLQLDLKVLMTYPLTPVPYSIGTADGFLAKTAKSKGFEYLTKDCPNAEVPPPDETLTIHDGNACFYYLKEVPSNFGQICCKVFDMMAKKGDAVFSTDQYIPNSVKSLERKRRGTSEKLIIKGEATKKPPDWKQFLSNDQNKKKFIQLLQKMWSKDEYAAKFQGRQVTLICDGQACLLTSTDGRTTEKSDIPTLTSSQEETDSRIILYCEYGKTKNYRHLRIKSPDSDVFYILLHYAASLEDVTVLFDTGTGNKQRLVNISELAQDYTPEHCTAIMALHAFSGCDTTSAFKGIGKVKPVKILLKMPRYIPVLAELGDSWDVSDDLINDLDAFTCALYGRPRVAKVDDLRLIRINELCAKSNLLTPSKNVDMGTLPPCRRSLVQHILRVNYQIAIWKRAHIEMPHIPDATDGHGWTLVDDNMEPLWYDGEILPQQLADIVDETTDSSDEDTDSDGDDPLPQDEECSVDDDDTDSDLG